MNSDSIHKEIIAFWFSNKKNWFAKSKEFDGEVKEKFGPLIENAMEGGLKDWLESPDGTLAYILLLDQFTRNVFRGDAKAFSGDHFSEAASLGAIENGIDRKIELEHRTFVYMPLMHSEKKRVQEKSIEVFENLAREGGSDFEGTLKYAHSHKAIVDRFGRYPHRNEILGRSSTPEEKDFLNEPGSSF